MPCPHYSMSIVKRSERRSVVAAAYQSCSCVYSEYEAKWEVYTAKKKELVYEEIMLPSNASPEYANRQTLWNAVEEIEGQWDSRLARRLKITLPRELTTEQNLTLLRQYCQEQFVSKGIKTNLGNLNQEIVAANRLFDSVQRVIRDLKNWLSEISERLKTEPADHEPDEQNLAAGGTESRDGGREKNESARHPKAESQHAFYERTV